MYQLLAIDFALNLESHLSEAQLARAAPSVDAAAVQVFAKLLDGRSAAVQGATFKKVLIATSAPSMFIKTGHLTLPQT